MWNFLHKNLGVKFFTLKFRQKILHKNLDMKIFTQIYLMQNFIC